MKTITSILIFLLLSVGANAQFAVTQSLKLSKSYADSQLDTTFAVQIGAYSRVGAVFTSKDSVSVTIYAESQAKNASSWTLKDSTTITSTSNTGTSTEWVLRDNTTEKLPGVANSVRFRPKFLTNNGTSSAKYDLVLYLSK